MALCEAEAEFSHRVLWIFKVQGSALCWCAHCSMCNVMCTLCRGGTHVGGQHVVGEDEVGLQREMGLVSGISLIVGEPVFFKSSLSLTFSTWPGTIVGSGIWQTAGSLMYNSGYTTQLFEYTYKRAQGSIYRSFPSQVCGAFYRSVCHIRSHRDPW